MICRAAQVLVGLLATLVPALAEDSLDSAVAGRQLVAQLLARHPLENYTNHGILKIKDGSGHRQEIPLRCEITVTAANWSTIYEATLGPNQAARLEILHLDDRKVEYFFGSAPSKVIDQELMTPFAGSDFWIADLGLEFLQWPGQKLLKKEVKRSRGCSVIESTNPQPGTGGYSRVVSWIDTESGGIVQAFAYDANNQLLKEFYPKDFKKVNGQWQVGQMEMENDQTGSRTRLEMEFNDALPQK